MTLHRWDQKRVPDWRELQTAQVNAEGNVECTHFVNVRDIVADTGAFTPCVSDESVRLIVSQLKVTSNRSLFHACASAEAVLLELFSVFRSTTYGISCGPASPDSLQNKRVLRLSG